MFQFPIASAFSCVFTSRYLQSLLSSFPPPLALRLPPYLTCPLQLFAVSNALCWQCCFSYPQLKRSIFFCIPFVYEPPDTLLQLLMVRIERLELSISAWKASVIPISPNSLTPSAGSTVLPLRLPGLLVPPQPLPLSGLLPHRPSRPAEPSHPTAR